MPRNIYYLPGRGGYIHTGLGNGLLDRGFSVSGRQTTDQFGNLSFQEQIDVICDDLQRSFWNPEAYLIAVS